jgi:uncharacterized protein
MFMTPIVPRLLPLFLAILTGFASTALPAQAAPSLKESLPTITVTGHAQTEIVPDLAIISLAVSTERPKAEAAAAANAATAQALIDEIKAQGIDAKDIKTVSITLTPVYDEQNDAAGRGLKKTLRGYSARNSLEIRIHAIDKAGALASRLIDKGANEVQGISFDSDQKDAAYNRLRGQAMQDALRQAKAYMAAVGQHLGRILEIAPIDVVSQRVFRYASGASFAAPAPANIPIEPGTLNLEAQVQVVWELSP